jgi:tetratricopeptide (TPR) repeat protein
MKTFFRISLACIAVGAAGGCVHTPPGTSVEIALAKKAQLIRLPVTAQVPMLATTTGGSRPPLPFVEPELPIIDDRIEAEAEAFTRGKFAMADGNDEEAIGAFEQTVQFDPTHQEAWENLAVLYEKAGSEKKAVEAFRKSKNLARH